MSKHPGPWYLDCSDGISYVFDAYGRSVCATTADPETRAILLHAREMFDELRRLYEHAVDEHRNEYEGSGGRMLRDWPEPITRASSLIDKIESEIAKGKP